MPFKDAFKDVNIGAPYSMISLEAVEKAKTWPLLDLYTHDIDVWHSRQVQENAFKFRPIILNIVKKTNKKYKVCLREDEDEV